jgi:hypothetical protein
MSLADFLHNLLAEGRVTVPKPGKLTQEELQEAERVLEEFEQSYRLELPGDPPGFAAAAAGWAAAQFYLACQFAVFRDFGPEVLSEHLSPECEGHHLPEVHYSVDLTFRFLPDLMRIARAMSEDDPLVGHLLAWAARWPLSSVGVRGVGELTEEDLLPLVGSRALLTLYVDRIIAQGDISRLKARPVREAVESSLGLHGKLAP